MIETGMAPGADLVRALSALDPDLLDFDAQLTAISGWEQIISFAQARQNELLAALDRTLDPDDDPDAGERETGWNSEPALRWRAEQLGLALSVSGASAYHRVRAAVTLVDTLPQVHEALRAGQVTVHHSRVAAKLAGHLSAEVAAGVDAVVMADEHWCTPSQFEKVMARAIITLDPAGAAERARAAKRGRRVSVRDEPDGMMSLWALLPAEHGQLVHKTLDAHARSSSARNTPGDHRTLDERRADALVELVVRRMSDPGNAAADTAADTAHTANPGDASTGDTNAEPADAGPATPGTVSGGEPTLHGHRPEIHVTIAWSTLIGLDDLPADLTGYGCIDAATGRRIAADPSAVWRRLVVDPLSGRLLDYGTTTYRPPADLRDFVNARDVYCVFPSCGTPAVLCDQDHRTPFPEGTTCACNLDPLCRCHHRLKHEGGWTHERDPDTGDSIWTDPSGVHHTKHGTRLPTGHAVTPPAQKPAEQPAEPIEPRVEPADDDPPPF